MAYVRYRRVAAGMEMTAVNPLATVRQSTTESADDRKQRIKKMANRRQEMANAQEYSAVLSPPAAAAGIRLFTWYFVYLPVVLCE